MEKLKIAIEVLKKIFRYLRFKLFSFTRGIVNNNLAVRCLSGITGAYYLILDIWGEKLPIIKNHIWWCEKLFWILLVLSLGGFFLRSWIDSEDEKKGEGVKNLLLDFLRSIGLMVERKIIRFQTKFDTSAIPDDMFMLITQPKDQIREIFTESAKFICDTFSLSENQIDINVIDCDERRMIIGHQKWMHSNIQQLFETNSAAKQCLETGEYEFFPDKNKASKDGQFILSNRDRKRGLGSAFIMPITFVCLGQQQTFIISFVTYGKQLCDEWDVDSVNSTKSFLRELCRRIELELCLFSARNIYGRAA